MTILSIENLPYEPNSLILMERLVALPWPVLLDSGQHQSDYPSHHVDIIAASPSKQISSKDGVTTIVEGEFEAKTIAETLFSAIKNRLPSYTTNKHESLPGAPGWYGCLSYDMGKQLETLPTNTANDLALTDGEFGFYEWVIVTDHEAKSTTLISTPNANLKKVRRLLNEGLRKPQEFSLLGTFSSDQTAATYKAGFKRIQQYIIAGDVYQINFAQRFSACYQGSTWTAYKALRAKNPAPMGAFFSNGQFELLSLSPERFIQSRNGSLITSPIKGTRPRDSNKEVDARSAEDLRNSEKDQAENLMIVDLLRNDFGKVCVPGSVKVPVLFEVESYPTVHHLVSTITGKLKHDYEGIDAIEKGFPGGSITGAPKIRAMEIIDELETHHRSYYCGSMAYFDVLGHCDSNINIRTFIAKKGEIHCWGGGGIVADSICEQEYQETFDKVGPYLALLEALGKDDDC